MSKLDLDELMRLPTIYGGFLSPDGEKIALMIHRYHENLDVFISSTDRKGFSELTNTKEATRFKDWSKDSKSIIVVEDKNGNERDVLYQVFLDEPNNLHPLTMKDPPYFLRGGSISPSNNFLVYAVNYDFERKKVLEEFSIIVHDLETGDILEVARTKRPGFVIPKLSPDGKTILYSSSDRDPSGLQWWVVNIDGSDNREVLNFGDKGKIEATWLFDGRVGFVTDTLEGVLQEGGSIGLLEISKGDIEWIVNAHKKTMFFENVRTVLNAPYMVAIEVRNARVIPYIIDLKRKEMINLEVEFGNLYPLGPIQDDKWVGLFYSSKYPADLFIIPFKQDIISPEKDFFNITDVLSHSKIEREDLVQAEGYWWESVDGLMIHGWIYQSKTPNGKTIVYVHGGPTSHSEDAINPFIQYVCSLGFNVFDPNYRGSTGYGIHFRELIKEDGWGGKEQEDIRTGIESLIKKNFAHKFKVGITGTSYGGYSSWWAITHFPLEIVAAAAPICGMTDLIVDYNTTRPDLRIYSEEMMGGSPDEIPEKYYERSPINFIQNIKGKLLIVQGLQDPNVTPENVKVVEKKLKEYGIPYEKLVFEDEGHGIFKPKNQKILYKKLAEFFDSSL